jgi:hypothetical protein
MEDTRGGPSFIPSELALVVQDDGLDAGALGDEPEQPRLAAHPNWPE